MSLMKVKNFCVLSILLQTYFYKAVLKIYNHTFHKLSPASTVSINRSAVAGLLQSQIDITVN